MPNISCDSMGRAMVNHPEAEYDKMIVVIKKRTRIAESSDKIRVCQANPKKICKSEEPKA